MKDIRGISTNWLKKPVKSLHKAFYRLKAQRTFFYKAHEGGRITGAFFVL
jgi:hypothetical protein